jgi:hypothetical protein
MTKAWNCTISVPAPILFQLNLNATIGDGDRKLVQLQLEVNPYIANYSIIGDSKIASTTTIQVSLYPPPPPLLLPNNNNALLVVC